MIDNNKITIKDIAEIAGVSVGTVDRVMHNRGEVAEETKEKVLEAIKNLHYTPNIIARSLALKKKFRFAVLLPESHNQNDYWFGPLRGVEKAAQELQTYKLDINSYFFVQSDPVSFETKALEMINSHPDAIIFPPLYEEISYRLIELCKEMDIPFSLIDSNLENDDKVSFIGQNSFQSGYLVGKLMNRLVGWETGKILIMLMGEGSKNSNQVNLRIEGFYDYFKKCACIPPDRFHVLKVESGNKNEQSMIDQYFEHNDVSGMFIPNSRAYKICDVANNEYLKEICIIGYDMLQRNLEYLEKEIIDFLIAQNPSKQGYRAILDLFDYVVLKKEIKKEFFIPIDIIMKENYKFYQ